MAVRRTVHLRGGLPTQAGQRQLHQHPLRHPHHHLQRDQGRPVQTVLV
jgi:hypothetical protein